MTFLKKLNLIFFLIFFILSSLFSQVGESSDLAYGIKLYNDKIYDVAITQFKSFLEDHPNSISAPQAQFYLAESYILLDDKDLALKNYQKLVLNYPKSDYCEKSLIKTAEIHYNNKNYDKAARYYLQVKNYFPKSINIPENSYRAISIFFNQKLYDEAKENIALLNRNYPINRYTKKSLILLAKINEESKLLKIAKRNYIELLRGSKEAEIRAEVLYNFSLFLLRTKNLVEAKKYLLEVINNHKKNMNFYFASVIEYSYLLISERKFNEVEKLLEYSSKNVTDKYKTKLMVLNGDINYYKKKYEEAIVYYEKAKEELVKKDITNDSSLEGFYIEVMFKLSYSYEELKEYEVSAKQLSSIISGNKFSEKYRKNAIIRSADLYIKASKFDKAIFTYKLYIDNFSKDDLFPKLTYLIGKAYYENKRYEFAYDTFKYFKREFGNSAYIDDVIYLSAESSMKLKKYELASEDYKLLVDEYSASIFFPIANTRLNFLNKYKLFSTNLMSKIAELSSRGLLEDDKTKLFLDWGKFYYYDLKDFVMAISFFEKYENSLSQGMALDDKEGLYLYAKSIENIGNANNKQLEKALSLYDLLISNIENKTNKWFISSYINRIDLFSKIESAGDASKKREIKTDLLLSGIGSKIDDENGTILYTYSNLIFEKKDYENALNMISKFIIKYDMNSIYSTELLYTRATILEKLGKFEEAISDYLKLVSKERNSSVYTEQSYFKLVKLLAGKFDEKLGFLNSVKDDGDKI